ncbi:hypothetical protein PGT21_021511 [Puccinia graminis f. sp. tritici]|uniref:Uncharacterized protein n=1 Tax=Puccinia graminis f. sp. tritici TaxID=56615 RepID=A0A5B0MKR6_PUCGR|nr:hypothetical protein PGT21_021511 [Puccinia graminis f. sp. tritici]KAA1127003.1 hypothetical protein PGTUg99_035408 [Puccinia graminis f. sp. tritici]
MNSASQISALTGHILNKLMALATNPNPSNGLTLSKWATIMAQLNQLKIKWPEANLQVPIDQQLDVKDKPAFTDVSLVIQLATRKLKSKASCSCPVPMDLDRIQATMWVGIQPSPSSAIIPFELI